MLSAMRHPMKQGLVRLLGLLVMLQAGGVADAKDVGKCGPRELTPECCLKHFPGEWERCTGLTQVERAYSLGTQVTAVGTAVAVAMLPNLNPAERRGVALAADVLAKLERALVECARRADQAVNDVHFDGKSPSREMCEQLKLGERTTWAMYLGSFKHAEAWPCLRKALDELVPGRYLLHPRFQLNGKSGRWEHMDENLVSQVVSREGWKGLAGTIEPDVVILDEKGIIIHVYDLKFPCPETNDARWTRYTEGPWKHSHQHDLYREALKVKPKLVSPRQGVEER
jgi:hypothetical protein